MMNHNDHSESGTSPPRTYAERLNMLKEKVTQVAKGDELALIVVGEPGTGKSVTTKETLEGFGLRYTQVGDLLRELEGEIAYELAALIGTPEFAKLKPREQRQAKLAHRTATKGAAVARRAKLGTNLVVHHTTSSYSQPLFMALQDAPAALHVFDDADGLLTIRKSLSIIKSATEGTLTDIKSKLPRAANMVRVVTWPAGLAVRKQLEAAGYQTAFRFTGRIIILTNELPTNGVNWRAVLSRVDVHEVSGTATELNAAARRMSKRGYGRASVKQCNDVNDFLDDEGRGNLRNYARGYEKRRTLPKTWEAHIEESLKDTPSSKAADYLHALEADTTLNVKERERRFAAKGHGKHAAYARLKKRLGLSRGWTKKSTHNKVTTELVRRGNDAHRTAIRAARGNGAVRP